MPSAANEYGPTSILNARVPIDRARDLLEGAALTTTGEDIRAVATQFERLDQKVQNILDFILRNHRLRAAGLGGVHSAHGPGDARIGSAALH